jgi:ribonuclease P protein component
MRRSTEFTQAVRQGIRSGRRLVTGHLLAVVRNKVRRRLRHLARGYLDSLPAGSLLVVRANPPAAVARQADLAADLDLVVRTLLRRQVGALR